VLFVSLSLYLKVLKQVLR